MAIAPTASIAGFCLQGCKVGAKASTLITHVPDAITQAQKFARMRWCRAISLREDGRVDGVAYIDREGKEHFQRARAVIVSGYAIETPRLLLELGVSRPSRTAWPIPAARWANI